MAEILWYPESCKAMHANGAYGSYAKRTVDSDPKSAWWPSQGTTTAATDWTVTATVVVYPYRI
jgi:hypothetical protein